MAKKRRPHALAAFLAVYAVDYQRSYKLNGLHPVHYDLLKKYGARMDDFVRATNASVHKSRSTKTEKPLFIPLRTEWFRKFEDGTKDTEYRAYGVRWNERTCRVGRAATVSHGYSGKRLARTVASFRVLPWAEAPEAARTIYPDAAFIAAIELSA